MMIFSNLLSLILGFTIAILAIPPILRVAKKRKLFDSTNQRKIHTAAIPPFGGIAIFLGFIISTTVATQDHPFLTFKCIVAAVILLFFAGLEDDLTGISNRKKFYIQILASLLLILLGNIRLTYGHGFFNIYEINYFFSFVLTLFVMLSIINAFNFIDGIDGLAAGLAIVASLFFGIWFYFAGHNQYAIMSFALTGSLGGFFLFNVFGNRNKLFMGDTGSLITGLIISILAIKFNELNINKALEWSVNAAPSVSFAVVMVPLTDTFRVITIRLLNKKSPFYPDNNHIHHRLLALIPDHFTVTIILTSVSIILILLSVLFDFLFVNVTMQFLVMFFIGLAISFIPTYIIEKKQEKHKSEKYHHIYY
ncbi:MAG: MraY family glycosyltransferase [Prolixibacteraceae bacterium]|nr:MraY family glycosyltransferase [Prolixibacteraceae bacterium]